LPANSRIEELTRRLEKEPGSRLFAQLAEELRKEGELADAIRVCRDGLSRHSNYPSARMTLGRALLDTGDLAGARGEFEVVLRAAPDNILASRFLAECHEGLGDLVRAEAQYKATLQLAPGDKQIVARLQALEDRRRSPLTAPLPRIDPAPPAEPTVLMARPAEPEADLAPIPLVAADEEFELERPLEAVAPTVIMRSPAEIRTTRPAPAPPAEEVSEVGPTIIMRAPVFERMPPAPVPPPPPAPAPRPPAAPPVVVAPPPVLAPPVQPSSVAPPRHFTEQTQPPIRRAPPAPMPSTPVAPPAMVPPTIIRDARAGFTALDEETAIEPTPVVPPAPAAPAPAPAPTTSIGDTSDHRRQAGLDTLFRFSAL
jgi:hypothetical protein